MDESEYPQHENYEIKPTPKKAHGRGPPFSEEEEKHIAYQALKFAEGGVVTHDILARVAKKCNINFFEGKKVRSGEGLWWRIKRQQAQGNEIYNFMIQGGSPKYKKQPSMKVWNKETIDSRLQDKQVVTRAIKMPPRPPTPRLPPQRSIKPQSAPNGKYQPIEILVKDSSGYIQKVFTTKFKTVEEFLFSLV